MPIYEYQCGACGEKFDKLVRTMSAADEPKTGCPKCGSAKTARALSVFAVGAEGAGKPSAPTAGPGCGRCGGPNPCAMG
ncbi:MAG: zinc ribbon domain-containing protein [Phycisphaerae bacterium]|nr:zinc ribbon domain-containing protein [Tepidisphaeraceae bacterium]